VFETLSDRLTQVFSSLRGKGKLSAADIDATLREIRIVLLEADVALPVVREFVGRVKERASSEEVSAALNPAQQIIKIVHDELIEILGGQARRLRFAKTPPTVIMLAGLQGAGKTSVAAKLALWLKEQGNTPLMVAADLQRPNAVQQLQILGEQAGVPVFAPEPGNGVGDPVAVARESIEEARRRLHNVVVIDTAGRLGIDQEMMAQAAAIADATDPDEILFVVDAMIGQDAVTTAQAFLDGVGYDGVVLTKLDGDARGGAALSIAELTGRPVMFASIGEKLGDFDVFHPDRMASRILDMGDMLTLIEQAEKAFDAEQTAAMANKLVSGDGFTLEDFVEQLAMVRKLGPIGNLLGMLPGAAQNRELLEQVNDADLDRAAAIVNSMTPAERRNPKILNGSRRARIAGGSGATVGEVNNLVVRFLEGQKMMKQMMGGGGIPGMPGIPGMRRATKAKGKKGSSKKKPKGGRPGGAPGRSGSAAGGATGSGAGGARGAGSGGRGAGGLGAGGLPAGLTGPGGLGGLPGGLGGMLPPAGLRQPGMPGVEEGLVAEPRGLGSRPGRQDSARRDGTRQDGAGAGRDGARRDGTRQDGAGRDGTRRDGTRQDGAGQDGAGQDGARRDGTRQDGAGRDGTRRDGTRQDGAGQDGARQNGAGQDAAHQERVGQDGARRDAASQTGARQDGADQDGAARDGAGQDGARQNADGEPKPRDPAPGTTSPSSLPAGFSRFRRGKRGDR
jgi:signal recognition particle subunit SRP54